MIESTYVSVLLKGERSSCLKADSDGKASRASLEKFLKKLYYICDLKRNSEYWPCKMNIVKLTIKFLIIIINDIKSDNYENRKLPRG